MREDQLPRGLGWVRLLRRPLVASGVDYRQFCLIVAAKFQLAARSTTGIGLTTKRRPGAKDHAIRNTFLINGLIGLVIAFLLIIPLPLLTQLSSFYTVLFMMFFLQMLSNYSSLILDPRDRRIFAVRGVPDRTINAARLAIVGDFLAVTLTALALPAVVLLGLQNTVFVALGVAVGAVLLALFAFVLSLFLYLAVLRYFDGERLKNSLNAVQIGLALLIMVGAQLPNLVGYEVLSQLDLSMPTRLLWWYFPAVPVWFAGPALLFNGVIAPVSLVLTGLALGSTGVLLWAYARHAGRFEQYLDKLEQSSDKRRTDSGWFRLWRRVLAANPEEATYFTLGWRMLGAERDYKLRVYPQLAYGLIFPFIMGAAFLRDMGLSHALPYLTYVSVGLAIGLPTAVMNLQFSHQPEAMAVFRTVPFPTHGLLLRGIVLAMTARLLYPAICLLTLILVPFAGVHALTAGLVSLVLCTFAALALGRTIVGSALPFSSEFTGGRGAQGGAVGCVTSGVAMVGLSAIVLGGGLLNTMWFDLILLIGFGLGTWLLWRSYPLGIHYDMTLTEHHTD
ncbi:ABC transporter permease [Lacticaseibacillus daqingensis]|uniref:ABC transporter permease n=1 Tax=Lacticaseibacillus daqingensis TaxID=2486014 RepID=UPI000F79B4C3|nr:ABC transporter permease [Lacticaseibacillus daqingensis]